MNKSFFFAFSISIFVFAFYSSIKSFILIKEQPENRQVISIEKYDVFKDEVSGEVKQADLSADGRKASFIIWKDGIDKLVRWEKGLGIGEISKNNTTIDIHDLAEDGNSLVYIGKSREENINSIYYWHEGKGVEKIPEVSLVGIWSVKLSSVGSSAIFYPKKIGSSVTYKDRIYEKAFILKLQNSDYNFELTDNIGIVEQLSNLGNSINFYDRDSRQINLIRKKQLFPIFDIDGDKVEDLLTYMPLSKTPIWRAYTLGQNAGPSLKVSVISKKILSWNTGNNKGVPFYGDFNGDGILDFVLFFPEVDPQANNQSYNWQIFYSVGAGNAYKHREIYFDVSLSGSIPVPADYDGDGIDDLAIYNPAISKFAISFGGCDFDIAKANLKIYGCGLENIIGQWGDEPVPADYNGDGKVEFALYQAATIKSEAKWKILYIYKDKVESSILNFGKEGDQPVPGNYNCNQKADLAVYNKQSKEWSIRQEKDSYRNVSFSSLNKDAIPFNGDFDGDGCSDFAFYSQSKFSNVEILPSNFNIEARKMFPNDLNIVYRYALSDSNEVPIQILQRKKYEN